MSVHYVNFCSFRSPSLQGYFGILLEFMLPYLGWKVSLLKIRSQIGCVYFDSSSHFRDHSKLILSPGLGFWNFRVVLKTHLHTTFCASSNFWTRCRRWNRVRMLLRRETSSGSSNKDHIPSSHRWYCIQFLVSYRSFNTQWGARLTHAPLECHLL